MRLSASSIAVNRTESFGPVSDEERVFPGRRAGRPLSRAAVSKALQRTVRQAGIEQRVTPHTLR
ncbi:MAG: tyrosine-type recombinase/integrase, partial [Deltaproteobacteria bacterium]|nr:tyrosine-type recombinase/integrase [Deltaproteobacteria bacterium]